MLFTDLFKVRSESLEPFSRNHDNSPDFKGICEFLFSCCQECVEVYVKVFTENKNQKIRAKNAKIGFATTKNGIFGSKDLYDSNR